MSNDITLKILQGLQEGAELTLNAGTWHFGTDAENDLILDDENVRAKHFSLEIDEEGKVLLTAHDGAPVSVGGEQVTEESYEVPYFAFIQVGDTQLALGPVGEAFPEPKKEIEKNVEKTKKSTAPISFTKYTKRVAGIGTLGFLGLTAAYTLNHLSFAAPVALAPRPEVADVLKEMNLHTLTVRDADGTTLVSGIVPSAHDLTQLKTRLHGAPIIYNVHVQERILASARDITSLYLPGLAVSSSEDGGLLLSGLCGDGHQLARLITVLKEDLPAAPTIHNDVKTPQDLYPGLRAMLKELGLFKVLTFEVESGQLVVRGAPPADRIAAWNEARDAFAEEQGIEIVQHFRTERKARPVAKIQKKQPQINVLSVSIGEVSYITLEGGAKYFEGATLENGAIVEHIAADHIVLRKAGRKTKFKLGG